MSSRLESNPVNRRDWLSLSGIWAASVAIFGSLLGMAQLPKPRVTPEASSRFRAGSKEELPPGTVKLISEQNVRLLSTADGIAAMSLICTHLGCIVQEGAEGFTCPCHGSRF
jgi:cytochrome b6-f complex iron-sulfur subunit